MRRSSSPVVSHRHNGFIALNHTVPAALCIAIFLPLHAIFFSISRDKSSQCFKLSNSNDEEEYDPRDSFGRSIRGFQSSALKTTIEVGDTIVCKRSIPNQGIYENSSYEITSFYTQYFDEETQKIVKQPLNSLDEVASSKSKDQVYMTLFSPQYHSEAVIVTPEEVGLVSIRDELGSAAWLAVPGFFWVFVAASFYNTYHERTGGSFSDAFWGRWFYMVRSEEGSLFEEKMKIS